MTGVSQVALPRPGRRLDGRARRQGRRLAADRPGLLRSDPRVLPEPPVGDRLRAGGDVLQQPGPEPARPRGPARGQRRRVPGARAPVHPRPDRRRTSRPTPSTTSASGVDPHISEDNARIQANRVAAGARPRPRPRARADRRPRQPAAARAGAASSRSTCSSSTSRSTGRHRDDRLDPRPLAVRAATSCEPALSARCASSTRATMVRNPVMFVVEIGALFTTVHVDRRRDRASPAGSPSPSRSGSG